MASFVRCLFQATVSSNFGKGPPNTRVIGKVKFFNQPRGYGFIAPKDGSKDVFVHATALECSAISAISEGDVISFEIEDDQRSRGKRATNLQLS